MLCKQYCFDFDFVKDVELKIIKKINYKKQYTQIISCVLRVSVRLLILTLCETIYQLIVHNISRGTFQLDLYFILYEMHIKSVFYN